MIVNIHLHPLGRTWALRPLAPLALVAALLALLPAPMLHAGPAQGQTQQFTSRDQVPEGLAKSDWQSIHAAYVAGLHVFQPIEGRWQARNPGQQWTTTFDGRGFVAMPRDGGWQWGLELKSYGFAGQERAIGGPPAVQAAGTRLTYQWDAAVQEWWVNDGRGLEHGFTVKERPNGSSEDNKGNKGTKFSRGAASTDSSFRSFASVKSTSERELNSQPSTLTFLLAVRGTLRPHISADAQGVLFQDAAGTTVLHYTGLKVWDADGKVLTSHFAPAEGGVRLLVDESDARYPLTIDPIAQQAYLKAGNNGPPSDNQFGYSVSVSGDTVVVGAPFEDRSTTGVNTTPNESAFNAGAAYVFVRSGTNWTQQAYLKPAAVGTSQEIDYFGYSVAVSGDTVVVGAPGEDSSTTVVNSAPNESAGNSGAAYVFTRSGSVWTQEVYLKASNTPVGSGADDHFGYSVASRATRWSSGLLASAAPRRA